MRLVSGMRAWGAEAIQSDDSEKEGKALRLRQSRPEISIDDPAISDKPQWFDRQTLPEDARLPDPTRPLRFRDPLSNAATQDENVLDRLARLTRIARHHGFEIRGEPLGGSQGGGSTWCEIRGRRILFLDLSQPATEQAIAIREILEETACVRPHARSQARAA